MDPRTHVFTTQSDDNLVLSVEFTMTTGLERTSVISIALQLMTHLPFWSYRFESRATPLSSYCRYIENPSHLQKWTKSLTLKLYTYTLLHHYIEHRTSNSLH